MAQPLPISGWYPDPEIPGHDRWWDGTSWTDNRRVTDVTVATAPLAAVAASAPAPVVRNNLALTGFILSLSGIILPFVVNSFAGGIVSIIGLRHSKKLAGDGIFSNGRGISTAGILIGFIWGAICLLFVVGFILFYIWIIAVATNVQYPGSPVT